MGHNHSHGHSHNSSMEGKSSKNIIIAFLLNLVFAFVELIGGYLTNSMSIMSDALHDFGDCISLAVAWGFQKKSQKKGDIKFSYGYKRFSLLGSVFLSAILMVSSVFILYKSVGRLMNPEPIHAQGMLWLAIVGVAVNVLAALRLKKGSSLSERAVFIHIMEDVLGWVAVLVASIVMMFIDLPILDPILSIVITIWVLYNVTRNLLNVFNVLLQGVPSDVDVEVLSGKIATIKGVTSIHDMHIWSFDGESHSMTLHVVSSANNIPEIKQKIRNIAKYYHISHVTIEVDCADESCEYSSRED